VISLASLAKVKLEILAIAPQLSGNAHIALPVHSRNALSILHKLLILFVINLTTLLVTQTI
jgi:hypothetical protein